MKKNKSHSTDYLNTINELKKLFPKIFVNDKIDIDMLEDLFSLSTNKHIENYQFSWNGKSKSYNLANSPTNSTSLVREYFRTSRLIISTASPSPINLTWILYPSFLSICVDSINIFSFFLIVIRPIYIIRIPAC